MKKSSLYPLMGFLPLVIGFFYIRHRRLPPAGTAVFHCPALGDGLSVGPGWLALRNRRPWVAALCRRCPLGGAAGVCVRRVAVRPHPR